MAAIATMSGGPDQGVHTGPLGWAIARHRPPALCSTHDSHVWHHYVADPRAALPRYVYAGLCADSPHPWGDPDAYASGDCPDPVADDVDSSL